MFFQDTLIKSRGHRTHHLITPPPTGPKALQQTLENAQAGSTLCLRRGERFGLRDEGQRTAASLRADALCQADMFEGFLSLILTEKSDL